MQKEQEELRAAPASLDKGGTATVSPALTSFCPFFPFPFSIIAALRAQGRENRAGSAHEFLNIHDQPGAISGTCSSKNPHFPPYFS